MSIMDKVVAAVTPEPSREECAQARLRARELAGSGWLAMVLDHHEQIEQAFEDVRSASSSAQRRLAQKQLATWLTGHSLAEDAVLYPAMALSDQKGHSGTAYTQQSAAKVQLAALETLDPDSQDYLDKLEHLRAAVSHHMYEEESDWFPQLMSDSDKGMEQHLRSRYQEEFQRYTGTDLGAQSKPVSAFV